MAHTIAAVTIIIPFSSHEGAKWTSVGQGSTNGLDNVLSSIWPGNNGSTGKLAAVMLSAAAMGSFVGVTVLT